MTPDQNAESPREWYFNPVCKYRCEVNEDGIGLTGNEVHVIEYAAYERLKAERDELQKQWQHEHTRKVDLDHDCDRLREENFRLRTLEMRACGEKGYISADQIEAWESQITRLTAALKLAREALVDAIDKIESEYCSHDGEHGGETCYAEMHIKTLAEIDKLMREG